MSNSTEAEVVAELRETATDARTANFWRCDEGAESLWILLQEAAALIESQRATIESLRRTVQMKAEGAQRWLDECQVAEARVTALEAEKAERDALMFPIMDGPKVPWSLIAPYEAQAQTNHSQSLKQLAGRGGLSMCEAMAIMSSVPYRERHIAKPSVEDWLDFIAERKARAVARQALAQPSTQENDNGR